MINARIFMALVFFGACAASLPAEAKDAIRYYEDPVYQMLNKDDHHPMEDMMILSEEGDSRAQFVLADLYEKGKGGFAKSEAKAREWFDKSAHNGFYFSFIRLAAMEKRAKKPVAAYKWYTLAIGSLQKDADRDWAEKARDQLVQDYQLTDDEISKAKKDARDWRDMKAAEDAEKARQPIGPVKPEPAIKSVVAKEAVKSAPAPAADHAPSTFNQ